MAEPDNNQMAFWEAMKEKYERRNESLKQQELCLQRRLEQLKQIMERQKTGDDCDCVPEKLEKPSLVQCLVAKGKNLILGSCKCGDPKVGEEFLCACHIQDPKTPLNVDPNLCPTEEPSPPEGCLNTTCDFYDPTLAHLVENPSTFSLKTTDIYYMDKLADLVKTEKSMQDKIEDLAKREHSYLTAINDMREAMKKQTRTDPISKEFKKLTEGLEEENKKLRNELEDLRLELKHCFERVEGPLRRSLEEQKAKCSNLENQLKDLQAKNKSKEDSHLREINEVKAKLCQACCTMVDLNSTNSKLKDDLNTLQNNCANLEDELLKQRLQEAENLLKFKTALSRRSLQQRMRDKGDDSEQDLGCIAKKLGDTLKEVYPCISDVPSGLTETAENIRQLTELVGEKGAQQRKKRKGKVSQPVSSSGSERSEIIMKSDSSLKSQKEIEEVPECACSNSSLRLKPKIGKNQFKNTEKTQTKSSSSASLATKPTVNMKSSKQTSTMKPAAPKKTVSKGCTCCPAPQDCDHPPANNQKESTETLENHSDVDNKKTGPSEEVIAVKNLGTLSIPPEETLSMPLEETVRMPPGETVSVPPGGTPIEVEVENLELSPIPSITEYSPEASGIRDENKIKLRRNKLAVDTTCDILDKPPQDIHVVTTIANTGSLEITTEGPPGIIETKVNYLPEGKIEIVTKLINRRNMDNFLDGTLIHIPEDAPAFDQSQYGGQFHDNTTFAHGICPEIDCNQSKTCEGICDKKVEAIMDKAETKPQNFKNNADMSMDKEVNKTSPYGQVIVNNNFILIGGSQANPYSTREWKNKEFRDDSKEESAPQDVDFLAKLKGKRQQKIVVHTDITSEQEIFRLSARQSLTDFDRFSKENSILKSSGSFVFPDVLDTISEGDEDHSEMNKSDEHSDTQKLETEKNSSMEDLYGNIMAHAELPDIVNESGDRSEVLESIKNEDSLEIKPSEFMSIEKPKDEDIEIISTTETSTLLNEAQPVTHLNCAVSSREQDSLSLEFQEISLQSRETFNPSHESVMSSSSASTFDGVPQIHSECQMTESLFRLSQNINGKITLKQSKSMYEKRGSRSEYLRICKSATLSLGSLKIDIERLKLSHRILNVGDFSGPRSGERSRLLIENSQLVPIIVDGGKELSRPNNGMMPLDILNEGFDSLNSYQSVSDRTYQCYVCRCSRQREKDDNQQKKKVTSSENIQNLEDRIDRLLEKDPLAECQCHGRSVQVECRCSRNQQEKAEFSRQSCRCSTDKEKPIPKMEVLKQQGDTIKHDENCTCVDCICNPCHFKKDTTACDCEKCECDPCCAKDSHLTSLIVFEPKTPPQEIVVMNFSIPCDCRENCFCNPCMDERKKPKRLSRDQSQSKPQPQVESQQRAKAQETSCKRCANRVPGTQKVELKKTDVSAGSSKIKTESQASSPEISLPSTWKNVVGCACSPPSDNKKAVCDCKPCECKPCSYPEKARKPCDCKPPKKEPKAYGPTGKCNCDPCSCESCGDSSIDDTKTNVPKKYNAYPTSSNNCQCKLCECLFCSDPNRRNESVANNSSVLEMHIEGEKEPAALKAIPISNQPDECTCENCKCDPCEVLAGKIYDSHAPEKVKDIPQPEDHARGKQTAKADKMISCQCGVCECVNCMCKPKESPSDEKNKGDNSQEKPTTPTSGSENDKKHKCPCIKKFDDANEPIQCNNCFICCETNSGKNYGPQDSPSKYPTEGPDPNEKKHNGTPIIGDTDQAKEEIKHVLNKIGCSCDQAEDNLKPLVKQASNFETTISRMKMKLNNLQQKCKDKDQIINSMTNDLMMRSQSGVFENLLHDLAHPKDKFTPDFTRTYVCDLLPKPRHKIGTKLQPKRSPLHRFGNTLEPILEVDRYLPGAEPDTYDCTKKLNVSGMEITDIRRVTIDSILIKWRGPSSVNGVTGYQIFVNDELKYRVLSPNRTNAVIDSLDLTSSLEIMLFAITCNGRCQPPALATYKI